MTSIAIQHNCKEALLLADRIKAPLVKEKEEYLAYNYIMYFENNILFIKDTAGLHKPFCVDFNTKDFLYKINNSNKSNHPLLKSIHTKNSINTNITVLDCTLGLARDSFLIASQGYQVTSLEENKTLYSLVENFIDRNKNCTTDSKYHYNFSNNINIENINAEVYLNALNNKFDIIYLDPMFPKREKSAKVKKESQLLQSLAPIKSEKEDLSLMELSINKCKIKVVVKRPPKSNFLGNLKPNYSYKNNTSRFDIYIPNN